MNINRGRKLRRIFTIIILSFAGSRSLVAQVVTPEKKDSLQTINRNKMQNEFGIAILKALQSRNPAAWLALYPTQEEYRRMLEMMLAAKVEGLTRDMIEGMLKEREIEMKATYEKEYAQMQQMADSAKADLREANLEKFDYIDAPSDKVDIRYLTGDIWFSIGPKKYVIRGIEAMQIGGAYKLQSVKGISAMSGDQVTSVSVPGEYYLRGVMETAAGFKLNADSSFEFFYSYGALDRQGAGTWKIDDGAIIFSSTHPSAQDFLLKEEKRTPGNNMIIDLKEVPSSISKYFHVAVSDGEKVVRGTANDSGRIVLPMMKVSRIELFFEWCPEKKSAFTIADPAANLITFQLLPSIADVVFDHARMKMENGVITGMLPFTRGEMYKFVKNE